MAFGARCLYLEHLDEYTVYFTEVMAVDLDLTQILEHDRLIKKVSATVYIFINNQAAILTIRNPKPSSGQYHIVQLLRLIDKARSMEYTLIFHWISAHEGIESNERVDKAAKEATG